MLSKIISSYWQQAHSKRASVLFFQAPTVADFEAQIEPALAQMDAQAFKIRCRNDTQLQPLSPFLEIIEALAGHDRKWLCQLIGQRVKGSLQRKVLQAYFSDQIVADDVHFVPDEINYERISFLYEVLSLICHLSGERVTCVALSNAHFLPPAILEGLDRMVKHHFSGRLLLLIHIELHHQFWDPKRQHLLDEIAKSCSDHDLSVLLPATSARVKNWAPNQLMDEQVSFAIWVKLQNDFACGHEVVLALKRMEHAHPDQLIASQGVGALKQALHLVRSYILSENYAGAIEYLMAIKHLTLLSGHQEGLGLVHLQLSICYYFLGFSDKSIEHAKLSQGQSQYLDQKTQVWCQFILFFVGRMLNRQLSLEQALALIDKCAALGWKNHEGYVRRYLYLNLHASEEIPYDRALQQVEKAIQLAREEGNIFALARCLHGKSVLLSFIHRDQESLSCLKKSGRIRKRIGDHLQLARHYNGLGYVYVTSGRHDLAMQQYELAIQHGKQASDYLEVLSAMYNIAWIYYLWDMNHEAADMLKGVLRIMDMRKIESLPYRTRYDLLALKGLCHHRLNEAAEVQRIIQHMDFLEPSGTDLCRFLSGSLRVLADDSRDFQAKYDALLSLWQHLMSITSSDQRFGDFLALDLLRITAQLSENHWLQTWQLVIEQMQFFGLEILSEPYIVYAENQVRLEQGPVLSTAATANTYAQVIEQARLEAEVEKLSSRLNEVQVMHHLRSVIDRSSSVDSLLQEALRIIHGSFPCDAVWFAQNEASGWMALGSFQPKAQVAEGMLYLLDQALEQPRNQVLTPSMVPARLGHWQQVVLVPQVQKSQVCYQLILFASDRSSPYGNAMLSTLSLIVEQLVSQIERIGYQKKLEELSRTDALTGLISRGFSMERLEAEIERARRYSREENLSVAYIDLDNFKPVNDRFGHKAGDALLQAFSRLMSQLARATDLVCRLGGDEFLVILPNTTKDEAVGVMQRLLDQLEFGGDWYHSLVRKLPELLKLESSLWLSCSIGVTSWCADDTAEVMVARADMAMYQAKDAGKNRVESQ